MNSKTREMESRAVTATEVGEIQPDVVEIPDGTAIFWETSALWGPSITEGKPGMQASALWGCDMSASNKF